jgi:hypothetical protein
MRACSHHGGDGGRVGEPADPLGRQGDVVLCRDMVHDLGNVPGQAAFDGLDDVEHPEGHAAPWPRS